MGETTRYEYDAAGRCIRETDALGNVTGYAYDALGRITGHCGPQGEKKRAMSMTGTGTWSVKRMQTDIRRIMSIMQRDFCMQRQT